MWNRLLQRSFDQWSETYDSDIEKSFKRRNITYAGIWQEISKELPTSRARLLELGVGTGRVGACASQHSVVGVDISSKMLCAAAKTGAYDALVHAPAGRLPFINETFDGIYTAFMFHSERRPDRLLEECWRILKPGGSIIVVDLFPRGRDRSSAHLMWSLMHSAKYEKLAPSYYKPLEQQAMVFKRHFSNVGFRYIDTSEGVSAVSAGSMSHGLISGTKP